MDEVGREGEREGETEKRKERETYVQGGKTENSIFSSFVPHSPFIQNRAMVELAAAWRIVGRVSQEWGARRPRSEPILKFPGACRKKESPKARGGLDNPSGYSQPWIFSPLFSPSRSLE